MASPAAIIGIGASVASGVTGVMGAKTSEAAQKLNIQGQIMQAFGQAFGMDVQALGYDYQANIARYQAGVADVNEQISKANAAYARDVGEVELEQVGMKAAAQRNEMEAGQGASGIDVNSGSSARVRKSMVEVSQWDEAQVRASAAKVAYGYEIEATMNKAQADIYRYTATENEQQAGLARQAADWTRGTATTLGASAMDIAGRAGDIGVTSSIVGAAGSVASKWMQGGGVGMFTG